MVTFKNLEKLAFNVLNKGLHLNTEIANRPPANLSLNPHDSYLPNDFDQILKECESLSTLDPSLGLTSGFCNPTKESESSISLFMGGCESQGSLDKDTDENNPMTSLLKAQTPVCDCDEGMNPGRSHELPPDEPALDIMQECSDGMEITNNEGEVHECVFNNNICSDHTAPETLIHTPHPGPGLPYPTPGSTPLDAPTPRSRVVKSAEATSFDIRTPSNIRSRQSWSKLQPTIEDAPDNTDSATHDYSYANDDNFRESDIESAIDESLGFLQDTSSDIEDSPTSDKKSMSVESNRSTSASASSSENDQPELPHEEIADRSSVFPGCETSRMLHHKRKFSAIESDWVGPFRNFRPRPGKGRDGNQCYDNKTSEEPRETSISEGALPRSTAGAAHTKTRVSSKSEKDKWKGHFSCHPFLSDLSADKKDEIERKCNCILRPDLPDFLEKHTNLWKSSGFWHSPSLDVSQYPCYTPNNSRGFAIWRYVEAMQADEAAYYLKSRLADIMLYLEYVRELDRQKKSGHPGQTAKTRATNIICGIGALPKVVADKTRKSFHEHKLVGERWWWCGCYLGRGLFLLCSPETGKRM